MPSTNKQPQQTELNNEMLYLLLKCADYYESRSQGGVKLWRSLAWRETRIKQRIVTFVTFIRVFYKIC